MEYSTLSRFSSKIVTSIMVPEGIMEPSIGEFNIISGRIESIINLNHAEISFPALSSAWISIS